MTQLSSEKPELFKGRHFNHLLIIQAVRWYVTYKLSYRDVCDLMAERGVTVVHTSVLRWVQRFIPAFKKKWKNYARPVGSSWRVDETYIKVKGQWRYLYRAVDKQGQTVDFRLSKNRDRAEVTLSGIELANKIKKGQFDISEITGPGTMILQVWEAVIAA
jgi:transposase-like protein